MHSSLQRLVSIPLHNVSEETTHTPDLPIWGYADLSQNVYIFRGVVLSVLFHEGLNDEHCSQEPISQPFMKSQSFQLFLENKNS